MAENNVANCGNMKGTVAETACTLGSIPSRKVCEKKGVQAEFTRIHCSKLTKEQQDAEVKKWGKKAAC